MTRMKPFPKKRGARLGQHLLTSHTIAHLIAETSDAKNGATVLEVGPGKGMLTAELLALGARVIAVEKDSAMVAILKEVFADEIQNKTLTLIEGDARDFLTNNFSTLPLPKQYSVAANIPYYITGELIRLLLTAPTQPHTIALLIQKEVAERIAKSKKESLLSLSVKAYGTPHYIKTVRAGSFNPPPTVDSAVLSITDISRKNFNDISEEEFFKMLHAGFGQKRKTLMGNIKRTWGKQHTLVDGIEKVWDELVLDKNIRAEDVPLPLWLALTKKLQT